MAILLKILAFSLILGALAGGSQAVAAGPFQYRPPQGPGFDANAATVVGSEEDKQRLMRLLSVLFFGSKAKELQSKLC